MPDKVEIDESKKSMYESITCLMQLIALAVFLATCKFLC